MKTLQTPEGLSLNRTNLLATDAKKRRQKNNELDDVDAEMMINFLGESSVQRPRALNVQW